MALHLCCILTRDVGIKKHSSGHLQTPAASLRRLTTACSRLFPALTELSLYLLDAKSSLYCLVSTVWSRLGHLVIVLLKARTCTVTQLHLASGCSASHYNATYTEFCRFKSYSLKLSFKDASSLTRNTSAMLKEMSKKHQDNAHDDNLIAIETSNQIHTCAQLRTAHPFLLTHMSWLLTF